MNSVLFKKYKITIKKNAPTTMELTIKDIFTDSPHVINIDNITLEELFNLRDLLNKMLD